MSSANTPATSPMSGEPIDDARWETLEALESATGTGFLEEIVNLYLSDTPRRLAGLRDALADRDAEAGERLAHSLKGSSSNIGATHVESLSRELEEQMAAGSVDGAEELVTRLEAEYEQARKALIARKPGCAPAK